MVLRETNMLIFRPVIQGIARGRINSFLDFITHLTVLDSFRNFVSTGLD